MSEGIKTQEKNLNWDYALPYRKGAVLQASNVRISGGAEHIVTLNSEGGIEREGTTNEGDKVITDNRGQPYIIKKDKFGQLYEIDPANLAQFRSKNHGIAFQTINSLTLIREDGTELKAAAHDYIFYSYLTNSVNVIAATEFQNTYKPDGRQGDLTQRPSSRLDA